MSSKFGCLFFILLLIVSFTAQAQEEPKLRGYTPPPMFGGASSTPLSPPPVELPAPTPIVTPAAPVIKKETRKVTRPPADKEQVLKDQPLPIEPLTPRAPQEPTLVPESKTAPDYVAPVVKYAAPEPVKPPGERPVEKAPLPIATDKKQPLPAIKAEDLLGYPVTSSEPTPAKPALNPLAVPASSVEDGLPLPGSIPAQKKITEKKSDTKKAADKKAVSKKSVPKKEPVKTPVKPVEKKSDVKKTEKKIEAKPVEKPALPKIPVASKPEPKKVDIKPIETKASEKKVEAQKSDDAEPYNVKGRKSMPTIKPTKVDRTELEKLPLPAIEAPTVKTIPSPNEKMIDQSLQDRLVEPDVKKIMDNTTTPKAKTPVKDAPPIVRQNSAPESSSKVVPQLISLEFVGDSAELKVDQKKVIDTNILPKLKEDNSRRLQILSYASPSKEGQSSARRISLARGLSLRSYLLEKGIQPSRIDIRALGEKTKETPLDRVDLVLINFR